MATFQASGKNQGGVRVVDIGCRPSGLMAITRAPPCHVNPLVVTGEESGPKI